MNFEIQAHRGARVSHPENTIPAIKAALDGGAHSVEIDLALSKDHCLVVTHDTSLSVDLAKYKGIYRNDRPLVMHMHSTEIMSHEVGIINPESVLRKRFPLQACIDGLHIPSLHEVLVMPQWQQKPLAILDLELKISTSEPMETYPPSVFIKSLKLALNSTPIPPIRVRSFHWQALMMLPDYLPSIPRAFLTQGNNATLRALYACKLIPEQVKHLAHAVSNLGGEIWAPYYQDIKKDDVKRAHDYGVKVIPYTVNKALDWERLIQWDVDGITTDDPKGLATLLAACD